MQIYLNLFLSHRCLLYFDGQKKSVLTKVTEFDEMAYDFGNFYKRKDRFLPVLLTCDVPKEIDTYIPKAVELKAKTNCKEERSNTLRVIYNEPENGVVQEFGICVRSFYMYHQDWSLRTLEWLEMMKILGAKKVFFYSFALHPNMKRVINYYKKMVNITKIKFSITISIYSFFIEFC